MALKLLRMFRGGYIPNFTRLTELRYITSVAPKQLITVLSDDQGFGRIEGVTQKLGQIYPFVEVSVYKRSDKTLLWSTQSNELGEYKMRNLAIGLECFVIAIDPNNQYNAVISDKVIAQ